MRANIFRTLTWGAVVTGFVLGCAASTASSPNPGDDDESQGGAGATGGDSATGGSGDTTSTGGATTGGSTSTGGAGGTSGTGTTTGGTASGGTGGTSSPTGGTGGTMLPPGRPTIPLPFSDDFETSMAVDWRFITANGWAVSDDGGNNVLLQQIENSGSEFTWAIGGDRNWTDVKVEMRVKFVSGSPMILLSPRWKDLDNYYFVEYEMEDKPKLRRRLNGSTADIIAATSTMTFALGQWHKVSVTLQGTSCSLSFDDTEIGTGTDSTPVLNGGIGIASENGIVAIDDVSVTTP